MAIAEPAATEAPPEYNVTIRAYVYPQGDRWYAASTDFVLMAEGADDAEAIERFVEAAVAYFRTALDHGWLDALNRRPPLVRRIEIRGRYKVARLLRRHPEFFRRNLSFA